MAPLITREGPGRHSLKGHWPTLLRAETRRIREREAVGHPGDVVGDAFLDRAVARRKCTGIVREAHEDRAHHSLRPPVLRVDLRPQVDALEHEGAER